MEILGYIGAVVIGVALGLLGGGGSILTVPILVYLFGIQPLLATGYSLFVVGVTSLVGAYRYLRQGMVDVRIGIIFGGPSIVGVFISRKLLLPSLPSHLFSIGSIDISLDIGIMLLFSALLLAASFSMIKGGFKKDDKDHRPDSQTKSYTYGLIVLEGFILGLVTGTVGAGGGFLIVPTLYLITGLSMKESIGTSLMIIAANSLIGFLGDVSAGYEKDIVFLGSFSLLAIGGILIGNYLAKFVPGQKLRPAFGWFILAMGIYIVVKELFL